MNFKRVEAMLYNHPGRLKEIQERRDDIMGTTRLGYMPVGMRNKWESSHTEKCGIKIAEDPVINRLKTEIRAVVVAYANLPEGKRRLVQLKYWSGKRYTVEELAERLGVNEKTVRRWRQEIVTAIGNEIDRQQVMF